jgi:flagellar basal-body rod protein FlgB
MLLGKLTGSNTIEALQKALAFAEARHRVLTENVANADTPGYRTKQLDVAAFQEALAKALARRDEHSSTPLELPASPEVRTSPAGALIVTPGETPPENVLFHDGTNGQLERQMAMLAENALMFRAMTELLRGKYEGLLKAIRGRSG